MVRRILLASMLCSAAACGLREFDKLANEAPVRVVPRPGDFGTQPMGSVFLPLTSRPYDPDAAGMIVVSGTEALAMALVTVSPDGQTSTQALALDAFADLRGAPVLAMAELQGTMAGKILLGSPAAISPTRATGSGITRILGLGATVTLAQGPAPTDGQTGFGSAVASGLVSGGAGRDMVVTSDTDVNLFEDGSIATPIQTHQPAPATCVVALDAGLEQALRRRRALVVDDIAAAAGEEIVVGVPRSTGDGSVRVMTKTMVGTKGEVTCTFSLAPPAGAYSGRARFGAALASGDFNKDGKRDLLVGAPPDRAFVYFGPVTAATVPVPLLPSDGVTPAAFGAAVAAVNMDGKTGDEAVVSDSRRKVGTNNDVGELSIFVFSGTAAAAHRLQAKDSSAGLRLGMGLAGMRFCNLVPQSCPDGQPLQRVLVAGTESSLYLYFELTTPAVSDLRRNGTSDGGAEGGTPDARDGATDVRDAGASDVRG